MHVAPRSRTAMAPRAPAKHTTQGPERPPQLCKGPMPMGAMEPRRFQRTVTLPTPSIKRPLKERQAQYKLRREARLMARRVSTTALPWVRPQAATSMRPRTATCTAIPGAVGAEIRTIRSRPATQVPLAKAHQAIRIVPRNPAHQAGEGRKRVADHRPSVEVAEVAGSRDRRVRAVQQAGAAVDKSKPSSCTRRRMW